MRRAIVTLLVLFMGLGAYAQSADKAVTVKDKKGVASYYDTKFEGRKTATGETFTNKKYTAASNKLSLGTYVKVTNLENGNVVYVRINDRMAMSNKRLIDLASVAAEKLDFKDDGVAKVKVEKVSEAEGATAIFAQNELTRQPVKNEL